MAKSSSANATVSDLKGCDLSGLLSFDPESIEPAPPQHVMNQVPASSLPNSNASKLCFLHPLRHWSKTLRSRDVVCLQVKDAVGSSENRLTPRPAPGKELKDLEEKVRVTKELICDKEASIACSQQEAECLKAELKTDLAEIRALNKQLVTGQDEDDEAEIAKVDHVRVSALCALEAFLQ
ncbi:hypothetical protein QYE76_067613 [Lolium multiflorum]|uniref:Uncharacterized protein n=1 Tax=Lolium multiflorum TaxID=4521 RepID=A0AAD8SDT8_LOLMU|nr:hypothetical protein QYE76_067613 [Lolium multiflorum]